MIDAGGIHARFVAEFDLAATVVALAGGVRAPHREGKISSSLAADSGNRAPCRKGKISASPSVLSRRPYARELFI
jgi:hypothetical protein